MDSGICIAALSWGWEAVKVSTSRPETSFFVSRIMCWQLIMHSDFYNDPQSLICVFRSTRWAKVLSCLRGLIKFQSSPNCEMSKTKMAFQNFWFDGYKLFPFIYEAVMSCRGRRVISPHASKNMGLKNDPLKVVLRLLVKTYSELQGTWTRYACLKWNVYHNNNHNDYNKSLLQEHWSGGC